ncbi:RagB/SusD family nutrient uptake outer membrane protein [Deminuibacter soli]|uniref:RagB/SusD family nutrient uptake outer membrane protein n=1 Tax=Deminuibacter soli TaxID=2291815 RepID=A0A3E1NE91_9BACT|nr:RagB/SusD family nutrient uptake outer membrane protein [Deminuibacter soli]RFM26286.1 RagB/SusD family nutrient uptake outer membrane protein [Deminuibacter soli]
MKKTTNIILLLAALGSAGCKKFLDKTPDSTRTDLSTPQKVSQLLGTAYPQANYIVFCEAMTDNVEDKGLGVQDRPNSDPYAFQDVQSNQQDSPEFYWDACYAAIAAANQALQVCNTAPDSANYRAQKGEALLCRAYAHFMLVNFFSKSYDAATASTDMGIPYVTEPETVVYKKYDRKTVAYVYDMIEKDMLEGLPLLNDAAYSVPRYHFNRAAANAFATRFYLFKKAYDKVVSYANNVFPDNSIGNNMRPWNTTYYTQTPAELFNTYSNSTEAANLLLVETPSVYGRYVASYRYGLTYNLVSQVVWSQNVTGAQWCYPVYSRGERNYFVPKLTEHFVKSSVNATIGMPYVMVPLLTTEEVLFNRAEANTYLNNTAAAIADLNLFASKRIHLYDATQNNITADKLENYYYTRNLQQALVLAILDFKRAEFLQEGLRWFDIMRYKGDVIHYTSTGQLLELKPDDPHRIFQLPDAVKTSGIPQNPR